MVTFDPIGTVRTKNGRFFLEFRREIFPALRGIHEFSHIQVLWWFDQFDSPDTRRHLIMDKPYKRGPEKVGVLATRGPVRPNPIAVTACALTGVDESECTLEVAYIDAQSGTPILDIKPYHPSGDRIRDVRMPEWCSHWPAWQEESGDFDWAAEFNFPE